MILLKAKAVAIILTVSSCFAIFGLMNRHMEYHEKLDSRLANDDWNQMSKEERMTVISFYLMGKLATAQASCARMLPSELGGKAVQQQDLDAFAKRCNQLEGVSELHVAGPGDLENEAARICLIIDQWYSAYPEKKRMPFLPLVDAISNQLITDATDLNAKFNSALYLR